jgi:LmbE family N-acetylglucosaminyl deacetylase
MSDRPTRRVLVSPHLDDLVLSCFGALSDGGEALTVFAGEPDTDGLLSDWDARCGAVSSRELMARRRDEDLAAMALAGASVRHLPFAEQHHRHAPIDPAALADALARSLAGASEVWVPAAVYGNPDHALVRSATFAVLARVPVPAVWLYAEYPYHQYLAPSSGDTAAALADWFRQRVHSGASAGRAAPSVRTLEPVDAARKRAAVECYASQLAPLDRTLDGRLLDADMLREEYAWQVRGAASPAAAR